MTTDPATARLDLAILRAAARIAADGGRLAQAARFDAAAQYAAERLARAETAADCAAWLGREQERE